MALWLRLLKEVLSFRDAHRNVPEQNDTLSGVPFTVTQRWEDVGGRQVKTKLAWSVCTTPAAA